jgi:hypothetical protein
MPYWRWRYQRVPSHLGRKNKAFSEGFPDKLKRQDVMSAFVAEYCDVIDGAGVGSLADSQVVGGGVGGRGSSGGGVIAGDGMHLRGGIAGSGGGGNGVGLHRMSGTASDRAQVQASSASYGTLSHPAMRLGRVATRDSVMKKAAERRVDEDDEEESNLINLKR